MDTLKDPMKETTIWKMKMKTLRDQMKGIVMMIWSAFATFDTLKECKGAPIGRVDSSTGERSEALFNKRRTLGGA